jgi:hypothetical protein
MDSHTQTVGDEPKQPPAVVNLPDSPVGRVGRSLLQLLDSADVISLREFVNSTFSDKALKETSAEDLQAFIAKLRVQSGGLVPGAPSSSSRDGKQKWYYRCHLAGVHDLLALCAIVGIYYWRQRWQHHHSDWAAN